MNRKLLAAGMVGLLFLSNSGCALVGAGAGRRSECNRIAGLSRTGEHKPAADSYDALVKSGSTCSKDIEQRVSDSRSKVKRADNFVRKAFKRRKEGNLLSARANLEEALRIYPNYYWVQNLLKNLERSIEAEINGLKVASCKVQQEQDVREILDVAANHMKERRFDEAEKILTEGDAARKLGSRGEEMLRQVAERRSQLIDHRLSVARESEQKGDVDVAVAHARYVLELSRAGDSTTPEVVEFARLLGVKLFSAGKLVKAKEIWGTAIDLDPGNDKLATYLKEVNDRLDRLEMIKGEDGAAK
jgi:tetratricopeptide (TPR) repeat protein